MSVLPIDLQVLFTKANEHSENIARSSNATQSGQIAGNEKLHRESLETNEKVKTLDEYAEDFTKVSAESHQKKDQERGKKKKKEMPEPDPIENFKRAPKEEGTGTIIDIVD